MNSGNIKISYINNKPIQEVTKGLSSKAQI